MLCSRGDCGDLPRARPPRIRALRLNRVSGGARAAADGARRAAPPKAARARAPGVGGGAAAAAAPPSTARAARAAAGASLSPPRTPRAGARTGESGRAVAKWRAGGDGGVEGGRRRQPRRLQQRPQLPVLVALRQIECAVGEPVEGDEAAERREMNSALCGGAAFPTHAAACVPRWSTRHDGDALAIDTLAQQRLEQIAVRRTQRLHPERSAAAVVPLQRPSVKLLRRAGGERAPLQQGAREPNVRVDRRPRRPHRLERLRSEGATPDQVRQHDGRRRETPCWQWTKTTLPRGLRVPSPSWSRPPSPIASSINSSAS